MKNDNKDGELPHINGTGVRRHKLSYVKNIYFCCARMVLFGSSPGLLVHGTIDESDAFFSDL